MSEIDRLVNACLLPGFAGGDVPPEWVHDALQGGLAGVVLYGTNLVDDGAIARISLSLRETAPAALVAVDEEGGDVTRLDYLHGSAYPGNLALGVVDDVELTYQVASSIAADLAANGVNYNLAPSVDVNSDPDNPVIGVRSFGADPARVAAHGVAYIKGMQDAGIATAAKHFTFSEFMLSLIPETFLGAFDKGDILPVLLLAVLTGAAVTRMGERAKPFLDFTHMLGDILMGVIGIIMRLAPLAAFGAMAFTVGKYGVGSLVSLAKLLGCVYATCGLFILLVLGLILRANGFRILRLIQYIREEILLVIGTSSSEPALPRLLERMEEAGCSRSVVGLVLPAGYSFNLDGTCIYLTMAAVFIAQATDTPLSVLQQIGILGVLLLTSKGAAAVTGGGFVTLNATLSATGTLPVSGLSLLIGIDRFMSEVRAVTNLIGNATATLIIAKWEKELVETPALKRLRGE